jgi:hypothetical protein
VAYCSAAWSSMASAVSWARRRSRSLAVIGPLWVAALGSVVAAMSGGERVLLVGAFAVAMLAIIFATQPR